MFKLISDKTLLDRLERVRQMRDRDINLHAPNPRGDGYLNRNDRYNELLWQLTPEVEKRIAAYEGR